MFLLQNEQEGQHPLTGQDSAPTITGYWPTSEPNAEVFFVD